MRNVLATVWNDIYSVSSNVSLGSFSLATCKWKENFVPTMRCTYRLSLMCFYLKGGVTIEKKQTIKQSFTCDLCCLAKARHSKQTKQTACATRLKDTSKATLFQVKVVGPFSKIVYIEQSSYGISCEFQLTVYS